MDLPKEIAKVRDGEFGSLPLPAIAKLNEICIFLGELKADLERRGLKMPNLSSTDKSREAKTSF